MEQNTRRLRNKASCPQANNLFNSSVTHSHAASLLPAPLLTKISQTQKINCNNVLSLNTLATPQDLENALQQCQIASDYQKAWQHELLPSYSLEPSSSRVICSTMVKQQAELLVDTQHDSLGGIMQPYLHSHAPLLNAVPKNILQDQEFLEELNIFLHLKNPQLQDWFGGEDYFER